MKPGILIAFLIILLTLESEAQLIDEIRKINVDSVKGIIPSLTGTEKIDALKDLSLAFCRRNPDTSISIARQMIAFSEEVDYQKGQGDGYFRLGMAYAYIDSLKLSTINYLNALRVYEGLGPSDELADTYLELSLLNWTAGRFSQANEYGRNAFDSYQRVSNPAGEAYAAYILSHIYIFSEAQDSDSANFYIEHALEILDQHPNPELFFQVCQMYGNCYSIEWARKRDSLGLIYKALDWYKKAYESILEGIEQGRPVKPGLISIIYNIGNAYVKTGLEENIAKGYGYVREARDIAEGMTLENSPQAFHSKDGMLAMIYKKLADQKIAMGKYLEAEELLQKGVNAADSGLVHFAFKNYEDPFDGYNSQFLLRYFKRNLHNALYMLYLRMDDFERALRQYKLKEEVAVEISRGENLKLVAMLEADSEREKTNNIISTLKNEKAVSDIKIRQSRIFLFVLAGFIMLSVIAAYFFYRQRKIRSLLREQKLQYDLELKKVESDKLKELDSIKSRFFANVSHEFRTPLTLIQGPLKNALAADLDDQTRRELKTAVRYAGKLQMLINNLLAISKLESGKLHLRAVETEIIKLLSNLTQSFESLARQKDITLRYVAKPKKMNAWIDREKFEQIVNNLLSNALKYTTEGGRVTVTVASRIINSNIETSADSCTPDVKPKQKSAVIRFSDTGPGIPSKSLPFIFDRYYRLEGADSFKTEGTGIGLTLVKELVEMHHGEVRVESEVGAGTTFTVIVPLGRDHLTKDEIAKSEPLSVGLMKSEGGVNAIDDGPPGRRRASVSLRPAATSSSPIMLIVEDNPDMRSYIREYFEDEYQIMEAVDGKDGLEKSIRDIPDIIISDVMMPVQDGNAFCRKVKLDERTCHIPVILLTARAASEDKIEGLEGGADDYLAKPFDKKELQVRVKNLVSQRQRLRDKFVADFWNDRRSPSLQIPVSSLNQMDKNFLRKSLEVVNRHLIEPDFNVNLFSEEMALSRQQLHRKIKALLDQSASEFIRFVRLNRAAELLIRGSGTISEIAYDVGFNSQSYFTRSFKELFGQSPSDYIKSQA